MDEEYGIYGLLSIGAVGVIPTARGDARQWLPMGAEKFARNTLLRRELWSIGSADDAVDGAGQVGEAVGQAGVEEDQVVEVDAQFAGPTIHGPGLSAGRRT